MAGSTPDSAVGRHSRREMRLAGSSPAPPPSPDAESSQLDVRPAPGGEEKRGLVQRLPEKVQRVVGLISIALSAFTFALISLLVSLMGPRYPGTQIALSRFVVQSSLAALLTKLRGEALVPPRNRMLLLLARCVSGVSAIVLFYFALTHMPMGDANVIMFTSPPMALVLAYFILGESFGWFDAVVFAISLAGVVFVVQPESLFGSRGPEVDTAAGDGMIVSVEVAGLLCLLAAFCAALTYLAIRKLRDVHALTLTIYHGLFGLVTTGTLCLLVTGLEPVASLGDALMLSSMGVLGFVAQLFLVYGLQLEKAGLGSMMRQLDIVFAYMWQVTIEDEPASLFSIIGALMVVSCSVAVGIRKMRTKQPPEQKAGAGSDGAAEGVELVPRGSSPKAQHGGGTVRRALTALTGKPQYSTLQEAADEDGPALGAFGTGHGVEIDIDIDVDAELDDKSSGARSE